MVRGELDANCGCGGNRVDIPCAGFGSVRWRYGTFSRWIWRAGMEIRLACVQDLCVPAPPRRLKKKCGASSEVATPIISMCGQ